MLPDDDAALASLRAIRGHLAPGGSVLVPLWVPPRTPDDQFGVFREARDGDDVIAIAVTGESYDEAARTRVSRLRYERRRPDGSVDALERDWLIHWYTPAGFTELAEAAGLTVTDIRDDDGADATEASTDFRVRIAG